MECLSIPRKMETQYKRLGKHPFTSAKKNLIVFKKSELAKATNDFDPSHIIGEDDAGSIYKGVIKSRHVGRKINVAIRDLTHIFLLAKNDEWVAKINAIGAINHPYLVKLIGYCVKDKGIVGTERFLVHEFMCNGSVHDHLENRFHTTLPWAQRLRIARDVAYGLEYLHEQMEDQIVYRIFKSSVVLLDKEWNAKLSEYVLGRLGPFPYSHPPTDRLNYFDILGFKPFNLSSSPTLELSWRTDVWSYGVFILELITGSCAQKKNLEIPPNEGRLVVWATPHLSDVNDFQQIVDPRLEGKYSLQSAWELAAVSKLCLADDPKARPTMSEISTILDKMVEAAEFE